MNKRVVVESVSPVSQQWKMRFCCLLAFREEYRLTEYSEEGAG